MKRNLFAQFFASALTVCYMIRLGFAVYDDYVKTENMLFLLITLAIFVAQFLLSVVMHELGHMLFGAFSKIKARPTFKLFAPSSVGIIAKTDKGLAWRVALTALGGCIVNLLFALFGIIALETPFLPTYLAAAGVNSLYMAALNIVPFISNGNKSDGEVFKEIITDEPEAKVLLAVLKVQVQLNSGKPLSEIDKSLLFDVPVIREDDQAFIALLKLRQMLFEATGDKESAADCQKRFDDIV